MTYIECIYDFGNYLKANNVTFTTIDSEVTEDDDNGAVISFIVYYENPVFYTDLQLLKNKYFNKSFNLKDISIKNNELKCSFIRKEHDEKILYI